MRQLRFGDTGAPGDSRRGTFRVGSLVCEGDGTCPVGSPVSGEGGRHVSSGDVCLPLGEWYVSGTDLSLGEWYVSSGIHVWSTLYGMCPVGLPCLWYLGGFA